jgi:hypothetical protein
MRFVVPAIRPLLLLSSFWLSLPAQAAEISAMVGGMETPDSEQKSYTWQLEYRAEFARQLAWSLAWINEGHVIGHHRDGVAGQVWNNWRWANGRWAGALGLGVYQFFDTQAKGAPDSQIEHGAAPIASASMTHYSGGSWFWRVTANAIAPDDGINVHTIALGVGYRLGRERDTIRTTDSSAPKDFSDLTGVSGGVGSEGRTTGRELTVMAGKTVVNATSGERALAGSVEYRQGFARNWDVTLSWLHEGDPDVLDATASRHKCGLSMRVWKTGWHSGSAREFITTPIGNAPKSWGEEEKNLAVSFRRRFRTASRKIGRRASSGTG